jgi:protein-S-isoprenylcysteine O-methyltransferase Ste14
MQTGYFLLYALASYACLDSRLSHIGISAWLLGVAILMMLAGCLLVMFSMPFLGKQSFGHEVTRLRRDGIYRYSRNPQLVGGFLLVVGYASLWPSWQGALWAALWIAISHLMIRGEERHLQDVFGDEYRSYCAQTPRFVGWPRR